MTTRQLLIAGIASGWALVALLGLGPARGDAEQAATPKTTLQRVADRNANAAAQVAAEQRQRSHVSAEAADARILRKAEAEAEADR